MTKELCENGHHFFEPDATICQCGALEWKLDPLAWPTAAIQDDDEET